jgi:hypothetical protein
MPIPNSPPRPEARDGAKSEQVPVAGGDGEEDEFPGKDADASEPVGEHDRCKAAEKGWR